MGQQLTPTEYQNYVNYNILPPRFYYSAKHHAYIEKKPTNPENSENPDHKGLKAVPRWQYLLSKMMPSTDSLKSGLGSLKALSGLLAGGGGLVGADEYFDAVTGDDDDGSEPKDDKDDKEDKENKDENNDEDENNDKGDGDQDPGKTWTATATDAVTSDMGQALIKLGLGFLPGGGAAVSAFEAGSKVAKVAQAANVGEKLKLG